MANSAELPKQSVFRWHRSTFALMAFTFVIWSLIAIPGKTGRGGWAHVHGWEHGWPAVAMWRTTDAEQRLQLLNTQTIHWAQRHYNRARTGFWSRLENWPWHPDPNPRGRYPIRFFFSTKGLAIDLGLLAALMLVVGGLAEFSRRRRRSFWQLSLFDILGLIGLAGLVLSIYPRASHAKRVCDSLIKREQLIVQRFHRPIVWLDRIFDQRYLFELEKEPASYPLFMVYRRVYIGKRLNADANLSDVTQTAKDVHTLGVTEIKISSLDGSVAKFMQTVNPNQIQVIEIKNLQRGNDLSWLGRFQNLERLKIASKSFRDVKFDYPILASLNTFHISGAYPKEEFEAWEKRQPNLPRSTN